MLTVLLIVGFFVAPGLMVKLLCGFAGVAAIPATILFAVTASSTGAAIAVVLIGIAIVIGCGWVVFKVPTFSKDEDSKATHQVELEALKGRKVLCRKQGELRVEETIYDDIFAVADALGMSPVGVKYRVKSEASFKWKNEWYNLSFVL